MLALRSLARALPRVASRVPAARSLSRSATFKSYNIVPKQTAFKAFSTSSIRREPAGDSDQVLSAKLAEEHGLETKESDPNQVPAELEAYFSSSPWKVEDAPGTQTFNLVRSFGNETIKVELNISDMHDMEEFDEDAEDDTALEDEDLMSGGKRTINQSGTKGGKVDVAPEDSLAPSDRDFEEDGLAGTSYALNMNITITKPGQGAVNIMATAEEGAVMIRSLSHYANVALLEPETPEQVRQSQDVYEGPPFINLDQELQALFSQYLEERDINSELVQQVYQYVDAKEQREYVGFLQNMKNFIDA